MSLSPLLFLLIGSSSLFVLAFAVLALLPRLSAARRLLVWQASFAAVAACVPLAFLHLSLPLPILPAQSAPAAAASSATSSLEPHEPVPSVPVGTSVNIAPGDESISSNASSFDWAALIWTVWTFGVSFTIVRTIIGFLILRSVSRRATYLGRTDDRGFLSADATRGVAVYSSGEIGTPMAAGLFVPAILIPGELLTESNHCLRAVLLHETAHVRRGDVAFFILVRLVSAIHWFNPFVWLAAARLRAESERAADDDALKGAIPPADYAETLLSTVRRLRMADHRLFPASRMAGSSEISSRLSRVLDGGVDRSAPRSATRAMVLIAASATTLVATIVRPVAAETTSAPAAGKTFFVRCVDEQGNPVPEAEVYLYEMIGKRLLYQHGSDLQEFAHGPLKTDLKGEASFTLHAKDGEPFAARLLARLPGKLVGGTYASEFPKDTPFEIKLHPSGLITGRVTTSEGGSLAKVKVRLLRWMLMQTERYEAFTAYPSLEHDQFPAFMETRPDAEGRFELTDLPASASAAVAAFGPGYGLAQRISMPGHSSPLEITLEKEAFLEGTITDAGTGTPAAGARLTARPDPKSGLRGDLIPFEALADAQGRFRIGSLREGGYTVSLDWTDKWTMQPVDVVVKNGETKSITLQRQAGTVVSGIVSEQETGKPIAGALVSAVSNDVGGQGLDSSQTGSDGRYSLLLPPGDSLIYISSVPAGFAYPAKQAGRIVSIQEGKVATGDTDITLSIEKARPARAAKATGRVVDEKGRPLANVLISARFDPLSPANPMGSQSGPLGSSDTDGAFEVTLYPDCKYILAVGGATQSSAETKFETGSGTRHDLGDFVLRPANATAAGIVVDEKGHPVANASVSSHSAHKRAWGANSVSTDAAGRFTLPHLLPDEGFQIVVSAPGFELAAAAKNLSPGTTDIRVVLKKDVVPAR